LKVGRHLSPVLVFRICSRPGGTTEISWLKRSNLATADPRIGHERRSSGVPSGTRASCASGPGDKWPGYCHMSLRDEEPSQEALIFVPFNPGLSPVAPLEEAKANPDNNPNCIAFSSFLITNNALPLFPICKRASTASHNLQALIILAAKGR
jgi:hypothetical protein